MDSRVKLRELRGRFARLDELFNAFGREPRPLEEFGVWRDRFNALFLNVQAPRHLDDVVVAPTRPQAEALLRTRVDLPRPGSARKSDTAVLVGERSGGGLVLERLQLVHANLRSPDTLSAPLQQPSQEGPPESLLLALKAFHS